MGRHSFRASEPSEVLTLDQAAELLRAEPDAVREQAEAGTIPARLIGGEWRFGRRAVLDWLGGDGTARTSPPTD